MSVDLLCYERAFVDRSTASTQNIERAFAPPAYTPAARSRLTALYQQVREQNEWLGIAFNQRDAKIRGDAQERFLSTVEQGGRFAPDARQPPAAPVAAPAAAPTLVASFQTTAASTEARAEPPRIDPAGISQPAAVPVGARAEPSQVPVTAGSQGAPGLGRWAADRRRRGEATRARRVSTEARRTRARRAGIRGAGDGLAG